MRKKLYIVGAVVGVLIAGFFVYRGFRLRSFPDAVWRALRAPQQMTIYSIDPDRPAQFNQPTATFFHHFRVLGQSAITDTSTQRTVARAIEYAVVRSGFEA